MLWKLRKKDFNTDGFNEERFYSYLFLAHSNRFGANFHYESSFILPKNHFQPQTEKRESFSLMGSAKIILCTKTHSNM